MIQVVFIKYPGRMTAEQTVAIEENIRQKLLKTNQEDSTYNPFVLVLEEGMTATVFTDGEVINV
jgi:hypothetical protein